MTTSNAAPMVCVPVELLRALVREIERETCTHEETHRGGTIWEICDLCGARWADDRGGKPEFSWSPAVEQARECLAAAPAPQPVQGEAVGYRYRIAPNAECRSRPWNGDGIVAEWNKPTPADNDTIQYQTLYSPAMPIAAPGDVEQRSVDTLEQFIIDNIDAQRLFWMLRDNVKASDFRAALEGMLSAYAALRSQGQAVADSARLDWILRRVTVDDRGVSLPCGQTKPEAATKSKAAIDDALAQQANKDAPKALAPQEAKR